MERVKTILTLLLWGIAYLGVKGIEVLAALARWARSHWIQTLAAVILSVGLVCFGAYRVDLKQTVLCAQHMKQIYQALKLHELDHGSLPENLAALQPRYLSQPSLLLCPAHPRPLKRGQGSLEKAATSYQLSPVQGYRLADFDLDFVLLTDGRRDKHRDGANHLLVDGCVMWHEMSAGIPYDVEKNYFERKRRYRGYLWQTRACPHQPGWEEINQRKYGDWPPQGTQLNRWLSSQVD